MTKSYQICCPKCNNHQNFYRYGKDKDGNQKYLCRVCGHQFVPYANTTSKSGRSRIRSYPICPICGKAMFLHHEHKYYSNYQCGDKKCGHSFFVPKQAAITAPSMSKLSGKTNFKRMRYPMHVILTALSMFYLGKNSFRNIALIMRMVMNIQLSHTTISNWCTKFAPLFHNIALELIPTLNFDSDEWHADETVVKIRGMKYYLWLIVDSETRFVLGFHLSKHRDSPQAFSLLNSVKHLGKPRAIVTDRYSAYKVPVKAVLNVKHIRVHSFSDDITNNLIECFNKQFKAWYKTKQGFSSFNSANNLIAVFLFFYNFVRPHSALNSLTPAQVAGLNLSARSKHKLLFVA
ncbi:IS6 family transposase [Pectinatus frisingensis]|uniref:IS6 family transposase n=1 Tax=Pectinatus frisingensis TaxID=865 RepID=UPI0018C4AB0D|nr:IS6 family transposase [Pectinatus frisingensis]